MRPRSRYTAQQSKRFIERKQTRLAVIVLLVLISAGTFLFSASRLTYLSAFSFASVEVYGADADIKDGLEATVYKALEGDYLGLFSKSNIFIYPKSSIEDSIKNTSLRVDTVEIERDNGRQLKVSVSEKSPSAVVCAGLPDFSSEQDFCYFADSRGVIFKSAPVFSSSIFKKYFIPNMPDPSVRPEEVIGKYATSTEEFVRLQDFYDSVLSADIKVEAILINEAGEYEMYAHNPGQSKVTASSTDDDLTVIYFNNSRPFMEEAVNLISFWKNMLDTSKSKNERLKYEYIDVRYGSNVFYRLIK